MDWGSVFNTAGTALSVGSGGIFGLAGSVLGVVAKIFQEKQKQQWQIKEWEHEEVLLRLQMEARAAETEQELAIVSQQGSWEGLATSIEAESKIGPVHMWVNDLRALFRPWVTMILWGISIYIFYHVAVGSKFKEYFDVMEHRDLIRYMVHTVFFCSSAATLFWFGDRALTPPNLKGK